MGRRSNARDALAILNRGSWCVVTDQTRRVLSWIAIGACPDWTIQFNKIIDAAKVAGWVLEEEAPSYSDFFCRRGGKRVEVSLRPTAPSNPLSSWDLPAPSTTIAECLKVSAYLESP